MVASLLRLLHSGFQDTRLIGQSIDTWQFDYVLVKAGRFTTQWQRIDFNTKPAFGTSAMCTLPRKGHLITRVYLVATFPDIRTPQIIATDAAPSNFAGPVFGWTNSLGHAMINNMTLDIGGARVEQLNGQLMEMMDEFYTPLEKVVNVNNMICRREYGFNPKIFGWSNPYQQVTVPLPFWFSRGDLGCPLPVDGLYNDEVRVNITFNTAATLYTTNSVIYNSNGQPTMLPLASSPFYQYNSTGSYVPGISSNTTDLVSVIPGIKMPTTFVLGDTYLLVEYITLDKPEANRFRQAEFTMPVIQHYILDTASSKGQPTSELPLRIPNPTRHIYFFCQRQEAIAYNSYFLATRDLSGQQTSVPWWPDCSGLNMNNYQEIIPGFSTRDSEPLKSMSLTYEGKFVRTSTENMALYRSILPSLELRKSPLINRYYYCMPFALQSGYYPGTMPLGTANLDKIQKVNMYLEFESEDILKSIYPTYNIFMYAETYNIMKVYGGRAGLLFGY